MSHKALAKIDKLKQLYVEQQATLGKLKNYVDAEFAKNRQRQQELNQQRRIVVRKCERLGSAEAGCIKAIMNSAVSTSPT